MSFMNFSGAVRPGYQAKRTSTIFVGDSITWGYGLNQNQTSKIISVDQHSLKCISATSGVSLDRSKESLP
jgi:hypothetical protein